jgi:hypothetical protein
MKVEMHEEYTFTVIDVTCSGPSTITDGNPFVLSNNEDTAQKILHLNDSFFDAWGECALVTPVYANDISSILLHIYVQNKDLSKERQYAIYGWLMGYFHDNFKK